jgi:hypothetical protein
MNANAQDNVFTKLAAEHAVWEERRKHALNHGIRALERLVNVAKGCAGQSHYVRLFLLGLYNGPEWNFDMTNLRALDAELQADAVEVLKLDWYGGCEIHKHLPNGDAVFSQFWQDERGDEG